jgi:hypothetical protein
LAVEPAATALPPSSALPTAPSVPKRTFKAHKRKEGETNLADPFDNPAGKPARNTNQENQDQWIVE